MRGSQPPGSRAPAGSWLPGPRSASTNNLAVGFALGAISVIGSVSIALSLADLELGARIGTSAGRHTEMLGGLILIAVGAAVAAGLI